MNLKYRGIDYQSITTAVETTEEIIGTYRGAVARRQVARVSAPRPQGLTYRGARVR